MSKSIKIQDADHVKLYLNLKRKNGTRLAASAVRRSESDNGLWNVFNVMVSGFFGKLNYWSATLDFLRLLYWGRSKSI